MMELFAIIGMAFVAVTSARSNANMEPNPPTWPSSVNVFTPGQSDMQSIINAAFATNGGHIPPNHGAFSDERYAFLFMPGTYAVDVPVGFYTTVHGLGETPSDVVFGGPKGVYSEEGDYEMTIGALDSFWRSAENFKTTANNVWFAGPEGKGFLWACSQAAPLRRIEVATDLLLFQYTTGQFAGYASGGYMSNVKVTGACNSGSQQQYLIRNCELGGGWTSGVWNMVFVGTDDAPAGHCGSAFPVPPSPKPYVTVATTPVVAEKPFITADPKNAGKFNLQIPGFRRDSTGIEHTLAGATTVGFENVYVTSPSDTAKAINEKLAAGLHVVLSPGIYQLTEPLLLANDNQVLLGLGMATLVSAAGAPVVQVAANVDGVRVAGLLLQAGPKPTPALLRWGDPSKPYRGNASNPGVISDVFARVGGPDTSPVQADVMVQILSGNVIGDDMWLWRADHNKTGIVSNGNNPCLNAIQVRGDDVTMYGLAVEHTLNDLVLWTGENGRTYFLQSEYPYDVTQAYGDAGYAAYKVAANVTKHEGYGVGVYHYFRDHAVTVQTGISVPQALEDYFTSSLGVYLNGAGTMMHIINDKGDTTSPTKPYSAKGAHSAWYCAPPPPTPHPSPSPSPTPPAPSPHPPSNCNGKMLADCGAARAQSTTKCLICCGEHNSDLQKAGCVEKDFETFCNPSKCLGRMLADCAAARAQSPDKCLVCCGVNAPDLQKAGCVEKDFEAFCKATPSPTPGPPSPTPAPAPSPTPAPGDGPFWGCGLLGELPGISSDGTVAAPTAQLIAALKATSNKKQVSFWNWQTVPIRNDDGTMQNLTKDFVFMPNQWGFDAVDPTTVRPANKANFKDSEGNICPATMGEIFLGANEPDIVGSCMGSMMGKCTGSCTPAEVASGCPVAHLNGAPADPLPDGHCDCWTDSHATGVGYWPLAGCTGVQPLPDLFDQPACVNVVLGTWRKNAAIAAQLGYKYLTTPLIAANMQWMRSFVKAACDGCSDMSCGCPTHLAWHFYANDCRPISTNGYNDFQAKLNATAQIMEEFPHLMGAIVNEVGMLNCAMDTPTAQCIPNGPDQKYPAKNQPNHACPDTKELPNGLSTFLAMLLKLVAEAKTSDGRAVVKSFSWFNLNMTGGTYNLRLFDDDGTMNDLGKTYMQSCQKWANAVQAPPSGPPCSGCYRPKFV